MLRAHAATLQSSGPNGDDARVWQARAEDLQRHLDAIHQSTTWRMTAGLRRSLDGQPALRRAVRRALKLAWWTVTLQLPRRYAEWRRMAAEAGPSPAPAVPPAPRNTTDPAAARAIASRWYDDTTPQVSIIVLNHNGAALTHACLASIWAHTTGVRYEIILADNGSSASERAALASLDGPHCLLAIGVNRQFGEGNNIAAERAKGEFVLFLNNDTEVTEGWLTAMLDTFGRHAGCGAVGARLLFADGRLQEAGALVLPDGTVRQIGRGQHPGQARHAIEKEVHYASACCLLMRREDFLGLGGFDHVFEPAYYEDTDLCFRLRAAGRPVVYCPAATVVHHGGVSQARVPGIQSIIEGNRQKFIARWRAGGPVAPHRRPAVHAPRAARSGIRRVLLHSPNPLIVGGGERYLLTIAEQLSQGYQVAFAPGAQYSRLRFDAVAAALGLDLSGVELLEGIAAARDYEADVLIAMGNAITPPCESMASIGIYICQFPFPTDHRTTAAAPGLLRGYDRIVAYTDFARRHVQAAARAAGALPLPVEVIYPPVPLDSQGLRSREPGAPLRILNVGRFFTGGHCKRQDELIKAFCLVHGRAGRPLELHLAGATHGEPEHQAYLARCRDIARGLPVFFHLDTTHETMEGLVRSADLYWHGTGLGVDRTKEPWALEHFGIAIAEAMSGGAIAFALDAGGPPEIIDDGETGFLFRDVDELAARSLAAITAWETEAMEGMRQRAIASAARFAPEAFGAAWSRFIDALLPAAGASRATAVPALASQS